MRGGRGAADDGDVAASAPAPVVGAATINPMQAQLMMRLHVLARDTPTLLRLSPSVVAAALVPSPLPNPLWYAVASGDCSALTALRMRMPLRHWLAMVATAFEAAMLAATDGATTPAALRRAAAEALVLPLTPLHLALALGHRGIVAMLLRYLAAIRITISAARPDQPARAVVFIDPAVPEEGAAHPPVPRLPDSIALLSLLAPSALITAAAFGHWGLAAASVDTSLCYELPQVQLPPDPREMAARREEAAAAAGAGTGLLAATTNDDGEAVAAAAAQQRLERQAQLQSHVDSAVTKCTADDAAIIWRNDATADDTSAAVPSLLQVAREAAAASAGMWHRLLRTCLTAAAAGPRLAPPKLPNAGSRALSAAEAESGLRQPSPLAQLVAAVAAILMPLQPIMQDDMIGDDWLTTMARWPIGSHGAVAAMWAWPLSALAGAHCVALAAQDGPMTSAAAPLSHLLVAYCRGVSASTSVRPGGGLLASAHATTPATLAHPDAIAALNQIMQLVQDIDAGASAAGGDGAALLDALGRSATLQLLATALSAAHGPGVEWACRRLLSLEMSSGAAAAAGGGSGAAPAPPPAALARAALAAVLVSRPAIVPDMWKGVVTRMCDLPLPLFRLHLLLPTTALVATRIATLPADVAGIASLLLRLPDRARTAAWLREAGCALPAADSDVVAPAAHMASILAGFSTSARTYAGNVAVLEGVISRIDNISANEVDAVLANYESLVRGDDAGLDLVPPTWGDTFEAVAMPLAPAATSPGADPLDPPVVALWAAATSSTPLLDAASDGGGWSVSRLRSTIASAFVTSDVEASERMRSTQSMLHNQLVRMTGLVAEIGAAGTQSLSSALHFACRWGVEAALWRALAASPLFSDGTITAAAYADAWTLTAVRPSRQVRITLSGATHEHLASDASGGGGAHDHGHGHGEGEAVEVERPTSLATLRDAIVELEGEAVRGAAAARGGLRGYCGRGCASSRSSPIWRATIFLAALILLAIIIALALQAPSLQEIAQRVWALLTGAPVLGAPTGRDGRAGGKRGGARRN